MQLNTVMQYADSHDELIEDIADLGHEISLIIQGPMGWGKSAMLHTLGEMPRFKGYTLVYIDCTTKSDSGDFFMIKYGEDGKTFLTVPHEELGLHLEGPVIIMFDEIGKMPRSAFNAVLRILYERRAGGDALHPDSIVFATTNLAAEGLGDLLPPHGINRCQVRTYKVPTKMEWLGWAIRRAVLTSPSRTSRADLWSTRRMCSMRMTVALRQLRTTGCTSKVETLRRSIRECCSMAWSEPLAQWQRTT
jgi:hypothetical protein